MSRCAVDQTGVTSRPYTHRHLDDSQGVTASKCTLLASHLWGTQSWSRSKWLLPCWLTRRSSSPLVRNQKWDPSLNLAWTLIWVLQMAHYIIMTLFPFYGSWWVQCQDVTPLWPLAVFITDVFCGGETPVTICHPPQTHRSRLRVGTRSTWKLESLDHVLHTRIPIYCTSSISVANTLQITRAAYHIKN